MVFYVTPWEYLDLLTHNLKAAGSNPAPATNHTPYPKGQGVFVFKDAGDWAYFCKSCRVRRAFHILTQGPQRPVAGRMAL